VELSWLNKIRIAIVLAIGVWVIGFLSWPMVGPADPFEAVSAPAGGVFAALAALAFAVGFVSYFAAWPFGGEIGVLAVPAGLSVWAIRSGSMGDLTQLKATLAAQDSQELLAVVAQRQQILADIKWEGALWLLVVAAGFAGVIIAQFLIRSSRSTCGAKELALRTLGLAGHPLLEVAGREGEVAENAEKKTDSNADGKANSKANLYLSGLVALLGSVLMGHFFLIVFAQDVSLGDPAGGSVVGQPETGQLIFAIPAAFALAAFILKKFLDAGYLWTVVACGFVTAFNITLYAKGNAVDELVSQWPAVFFSNSVMAILPVQMVALGVIGAIGGYWGAIKFEYWRKHESD